MPMVILVDRKGQIRMFETMAVLIIFFILMVIVIVFYANIQQSSTIQKTREFKELRAIEAMNNLLFLPELQCEQSVEIYTCIDKLKLVALSEVVNDPDMAVYYADLFGKATIEVEELYGSEAGTTWILYERTDVGIFTGIPVSLWDPVSDTYGLGLLKIRTD